MSMSQSISQIISRWKEKAEIDYFPIFISLWLSMNAWMKDHCTGDGDRSRLNDLKSKRYVPAAKFADLIRSSDAKGVSFRGNLAELHHALEAAKIPYLRHQWTDSNNYKDKAISFTSCPINWESKKSNLESVVKTKGQRSKIKIVDGVWFEDDDERLFGAYMEIVYQIRCALFHGDLAPDRENERIIKQLYLTLSMIMENI